MGTHRITLMAGTPVLAPVVGSAASVAGRLLGRLGRSFARRLEADLDHRDPDFAAKLKAACPDGIDVYFENVGGAVFEAVFPLLNFFARIPVCGLIAQYSQVPTADAAPTPDLRPQMLRDILTRSIRIQGFIIFDSYGNRYGEFAQQMGEWVAQGKIKYREHLVDGLENAPQAFIGLLEGKNFGKMVVKADA